MNFSQYEFSRLCRKFRRIAKELKLKCNLHLRKKFLIKVNFSFRTSQLVLSQIQVRFPNGIWSRDVQDVTSADNFMNNWSCALSGPWCIGGVSVCLQTEYASQPSELLDWLTVCVESWIAYYSVICLHRLTSDI